MIPSTRTTTVAAVLLLTLQASLLSWLVFYQLVNTDEGIYLGAARLVVDGYVPYRDFMYLQMPYFAYFFAPLVLLDLPLLTAARFVSVASSVALSALVYYEARRRGLGGLAGLALLALFVLHGVKLSTHATAITHAPSDLLAFASFAALSHQRPLLAGVCLGFAVGIRLPFAPLFPVYALALWWRGEHRALADLAGGFALALTPAFAFFLVAPEHFIFGNVTYHALGSRLPTVLASLQQKAVVLFKWLVFPQNLMLLVIAGLAGARLPRLAAAATLVLGATFLSAAPVHFVYVVQILPFLFLAAAPGFARLAQRRVLLVAIAVLYTLSAFPSLGLSPPLRVFSKYREHKSHVWNRANVAAVVDLIRQHSEPGDRVLSWWPGYPPLAGREGYIGIGRGEANVARARGDAEAMRLHCMTQPQIARLIAAGEPKVIVASDDVWVKLRREIRKRYDRVGTVGAVRVYARKALN